MASAPPTSEPSGIVPQTRKRIDGVHPSLQPLGRDRLAQAHLLDVVDDRAEAAEHPAPTTRNGIAAWLSGANGISSAAGAPTAMPRIVAPFTPSLRRSQSADARADRASRCRRSRRRRRSDRRSQARGPDTRRRSRRRRRRSWRSSSCRSRAPAGRAAVVGRRSAALPTARRSSLRRSRRAERRILAACGSRAVNAPETKKLHRVRRGSRTAPSKSCDQAAGDARPGDRRARDASSGASSCPRRASRGRRAAGRYDWYATSKKTVWIPTRKPTT